MLGVSPLALPGYALREGCPDRGGPDWGLCVHTTGDDDAINRRILARVPELGLRAAGAIYADIYARAEFYPHAVGGWEGELHAIADERKRVPHAGLHETQRQQYLSGAWQTSWILYEGTTRAADAKLVEQWHERWPRWRSPQHLFPTASPNDCYVGLELVPICDGVPGLEPLAPGLKFTAAQHDLVARYFVDLARRAGGQILLDSPNRLVGHEDINPMDRPGWDPGHFKGWFDWGYVRRQVAQLGAAVAV